MLVKIFLLGYMAWIMSNISIKDQSLKISENDFSIAFAIPFLQVEIDLFQILEDKFILFATLGLGMMIIFIFILEYYFFIIVNKLFDLITKILINAVTN